MAFPIRLVSALLVAILPLAGCGKEATEPMAGGSPGAAERTDGREQPPASALARPIFMLQAKAGRILVPRSALVERGGIPGVFVTTAENQARFRMVRTGKRQDDRVEILSGLRGGETLVVGDLRDVLDGSAIRPEIITGSPDG